MILKILYAKKNASVVSDLCVRQVYTSSVLRTVHTVSLTDNMTLCLVITQ